MLDYAEHVWTRDASVARSLCAVGRGDRVTSGADLEVRLNDHRLDLERHDRDGVLELEGRVPPGAPADGEGRVRVSFRAAARRPCDLDPANPDTRHLGVAVSGISIRPAAVDLDSPPPSRGLASFIRTLRRRGRPTGTGGA